MDTMHGHDPRATVAENYRRFARREASGRSPLYAELSEGVARDPAMLAFLAEQPFEKRQPNHPHHRRRRPRRSLAAASLTDWTLAPASAAGTATTARTYRSKRPPVVTNR
jgi:hypothetical protein